MDVCWTPCSNPRQSRCAHVHPLFSCHSSVSCFKNPNPLVSVPLFPIPLQPVSLLGGSTEDHGPLLVAQGRHPAHALDDAVPAGPGVLGVDGANRPIAAEHDAAGAESGQDNSKPAKSGLEDVIGGFIPEGIGHLRKATRQLHVGVGVLAKSVHGGTPGNESLVGGEVVDAEVGLAEVV